MSAKAGSSFEVVISGANLDDVTTLRFSHAGIAAKPNMEEPNSLGLDVIAIPNTFVVSVAANVPPGRYEARAVGKFGVSNPCPFFVSQLTPLSEVEPNNEQATATSLTLPADVTGKFAANGDVDYYEFTAAKTERIILECYARRADSTADVVVMVTDSTGKQLGNSRDGYLRDPLVDFQATAGQSYSIRVYDTGYRGGADYIYRFTIGSLPHIDYLDPPAATAGGSRSFTAFGRNLPGGQNAGVSLNGRPLQKLAVTIPLPATGAAPKGMFASTSAASIEAVPFQLKNNVGWSNRVLAGVARAPIVQEKEPNNTALNAQALMLPAEVMGKFYPSRDRDWYTFSAQQNERIAIEVISSRLGSASAPALLLQQLVPPTEGQTEPVVQTIPITSANMNATTAPGAVKDPTHVFTAATDSNYRILVFDRNEAMGSDPRKVYQLRIRSVVGDFQLAAAPANGAGGLLLRRGGKLGIQVFAFRKDGFNGEIEITASGLPAGVTAGKLVLGPTQSHAVLTLSAAANAAAAVADIKITGRSQVNNAAVVRNAALATVAAMAPAQNNQPARPVEFRLADAMTLSVTASETAPTAITAGDNKIVETSRGGIVKLPYSRTGSFKGVTRLTVGDLPANITAPAITINANQNGGTVDIKLAATAPTGTYTFHLAGVSEQVDYTYNPEAAAAAAERKKVVDKIVTDKSAAAKTAADAKAVADKAAIDATNLVNQAKTNVATAQTAVDQNAAAVKTAQTAVAAAQKLVTAMPEDATAKTALAGAQKQLADVVAKTKPAADALAKATAELKTVETSLTEALSKQTTANEEKLAADELLKTATTLKAATDKKATDTANAAKPRKINTPVVSNPIILKIAPAPIELAAIKTPITVKQGEAVEIPVSFVRKFQYQGAVSVALSPPSGVGGLSIPNVSIAANQSSGIIKLTAAANATPGSHNMNLRVTIPHNGQSVVLEKVVTITIVAVAPPTSK